MKKIWQCTKCGNTLGITEGQIMRVRYKEAQYTFQSDSLKASAVCRICSRINNLSLSKGEEVKTVDSSLS
jgi:hypothetical protein